MQSLWLQVPLVTPVASHFPSQTAPPSPRPHHPVPLYTDSRAAAPFSLPAGTHNSGLDELGWKFLGSSNFTAPESQILFFFFQIYLHVISCSVNPGFCLKCLSSSVPLRNVGFGNENKEWPLYFCVHSKIHLWKNKLPWETGASVSLSGFCSAAYNIEEKALPPPRSFPDWKLS